MMKQLPFLVILFFLASCSFQQDEQPMHVFDDPTASIQSKLKEVLSESYMTKMGFDLAEINTLHTLYNRRSYNPFWINDSTLTIRGLKMRSIIENSISFGIPKNRIIQRKHQYKWIEEEVYITANMLLIYNDLNYGFIDLISKKYKERSLIEHERIDSILAANKNNLLDSLFLTVHSSDSSYQFLAKGLYSFSKALKIDNINFAYKPEKNDTIAYKKTIKALMKRGWLIDSVGVGITEWYESIKKLQRIHGLTPHGHLDKNTCAALNESNYRKLLRMSLELEKIRQQIKRPKKYVLINIPSFELSFFADDTLRSFHRIITGKLETPTPTLSSKINSIIVYPTWTVPASIAKNELLPAVKRNVNYLRKNNYRIYQNGVEIDPHNVNWARIKGGFPYKVVQDPGPTNSLGIIKFEFNNTYSVYVHDTPSKSLFMNDVRAYSHGCMRCQNPTDLAKLILSFDSLPYRQNPYTADSLDTLIVRAKNFPIRLIEPVPIFVEYHTITSSRKGIRIHLDVYKKEEDFIAFMEK